MVQKSILRCQPRDHLVTICRPRPSNAGFMDLQSDTSQVHPLDTMVGSLYAAMYLTIREVSGSLASTQQVILFRKAATTLPAWG